MRKKWLRVRPGAVTLFLVAPFLAEVLPGVNPPAELLRQPWAVVPLVMLYGSAALLAREITLRWKGGYGTLLLLGAVHGVMEEGLLVRSFFDPAWLRRPELMHYGRWMGVNVLWALHLTLYHAVFSIAVPVTLVQQGRSWSQAQPWLGRQGWWLVGGLYLLRLALGWVGDSSYRASGLQVIGTFAVVVFLLFLARRQAVHERGQVDKDVVRQAPPPWKLSLWALGVSGLFFLISWGFPLWRVPAWMVVFLVVALAVGALVQMRAWGRRGGWGPRHRFALAAGGVSFFILLAWVQEWRPDPAASRQGMAALGFLTALTLLWVYHRLPPQELTER